MGCLFSVPEVVHEPVTVEKGADVTRIGWILKRNDEPLAQWEKLFCVVSRGQLAFYSNQTSGDDHLAKNMISSYDLHGAHTSMKPPKEKEYIVQLVLEDETLLLNTTSSADQKDWHDAIHTEIDVANNLALAQGVKNSGVEKWLNVKAQEYQAAFDALREGYKLKKHYISFGMRKSHDRFLRITKDEKQIIWYDPSSSAGEKDPSTTVVDIANISEIIRGSETVALDFMSNDVTLSSKCFSILTSEKSYDFEAASPGERNSICNQINCIIEEHKRRKVKQQQQEKESKLRAPSESREKLRNMIAAQKKK